MLTYADDGGPVYQLWSGSNVTLTNRVTNSSRFFLLESPTTAGGRETERGRGGAVVLAHLLHIKTHLTRKCKLVVYAHTHPVTLAHTLYDDYLCSLNRALIEP